MPNTAPRPTMPSRICPTCGTRIAETATRCAVCGTEFGPVTGRAGTSAHRMAGAQPGANLPIGLLFAAPPIFIIAGALIVVLLVRLGYFPVNATPAPEASITPTITQTQPPTNTEAPTFTPSPLPPIQITVQPDETCYTYVTKYHVPLSEIISLNNLPAECNTLRIGQQLLIPQPTPTMPPPATATAGVLEMTKTACELFPYKVKEGDTLFLIASNYNVSMDSLRKWNQNIIGDSVFLGLTINIPLCERLPTAGPTPTPTIPPPYPAPNLLSPKDGVVYASTDDTIALQWASVATLRENEAYQITIEDMVTGNKVVDYVADTRYIVPVSLRPTDGSTHIFRWSIAVVRQSGTTDAGKPLYTPAGAASEKRVFGWGGTAPAKPTQTPSSP